MQLMKAMGEHCETFCQIFFLGHNFIWHFKLGGREIPNALNACAHHHFGGFLGRSFRDGQHAQPNFATPHKRDQLVNGLHLAAMNPLANHFWILVKSTHDAEAKMMKALVAEQRRSQTADSNQHRLGLVVPAEKPFDGGN
jgi:hypothetical protein